MINPTDLNPHTLPDRTLKLGKTYTFTGVSLDNFNCYSPDEIHVRWLIGGRLVSTQNQWIHKFEDTGKYWITVKVYDKQWNLLDFKQMYVIVEQYASHTQGAPINTQKKETDGIKICSFCEGEAIPTLVVREVYICTKCGAEGETLVQWKE